MRITGISLNIATILIGSTVLGSTENDQIHFFYHFQEGRSNGSTAGRVTTCSAHCRRPIAFATLINAGGFLALTFSDLPALRQFGIVFCLSLCTGVGCRFYGAPGSTLDPERGASALNGVELPDRCRDAARHRKPRAAHRPYGDLPVGAARACGATRHMKINAYRISS